MKASELAQLINQKINSDDNEFNEQRVGAYRKVIPEQLVAPEYHESAADWIIFSQRLIASRRKITLKHVAMLFKRVTRKDQRNNRDLSESLTMMQELFDNVDQDITKFVASVIENKYFVADQVRQVAGLPPSCGNNFKRGWKQFFEVIIEDENAKEEHVCDVIEAVQGAWGKTAEALQDMRQYYDNSQENFREFVRRLLDVDIKLPANICVYLGINNNANCI